MKAFRQNKNIKDFANLDEITEEYLSIYIFHNLVEEKMAPDSISVEGYEHFHLLDTTVRAYDLFYKEYRCECKNAVDNYLLTHLSVFSLFRRTLYKKWYPKPVVWEERAHTQYYVNQLEDSFTFELFVYLSFYKRGVDLKPYWNADGQDSGENELGVEIKYDKESANTGNYYIEYAEKSNENNNDYIASGILKEDNTRLFFIGNKTEYVILKKSNLVDIYNQQKQLMRDIGRTGEGYRFVSIATSKGLLIRKELAKDISISIDDAVKMLI